MPRPKNIAPTYRRHRDSARCWVKGKWINLGKWNSPESKAEFGRIVAQLAAAPAADVAPRHRSATATVSQVLAAFWQHVQRHYCHPDGTPTSEQGWYRDSLKHVRRLYGHTVAAEFGPLALKTVRQAMIDDNLARKLVNARIGRVKRAFKWAASEELIPVATFQALATVTGLRAGRTVAHETAPIGPANPATVDAALPFLNRHLRAMAELHRLTGMRPGELCRLRLVDIDRTGELWVYKPPHHKTQHHGRSVPL
jgi:integrase